MVFHYHQWFLFSFWVNVIYHIRYHYYSIALYRKSNALIKSPFVLGWLYCFYFYLYFSNYTLTISCIQSHEYSSNDVWHNDEKVYTQDRNLIECLSQKGKLNRKGDCIAQYPFYDEVKSMELSIYCNIFVELVYFHS